MTSFSLQLPNFGFQEQISNGAGAAALASGSGASAFAMASAGGASAMAAAGTGLNEQSILGGFNQLDQAAGNQQQQQQQQDPMKNLLQMFMQLMMMMMQIMMQMLGMNPKEQSRENQSVQSQPQQTQPQQTQPQSNQTQQTQPQQTQPQYNIPQYQQPQYNTPQYVQPELRPTDTPQNSQNQFSFVAANAASGNSAAAAVATSKPPTAAASAYASPTTNKPAVTTAQDKGDGKSFSLDQVDQKELDAVKGQDLTAVDKEGYPIYLLAEGSQDKKVHLYKQAQYGGGVSYESVLKTNSNMFPLAIGNNQLIVSDREKNKQAAAAAKGSSSDSSSTTSSAASMAFAMSQDGDSYSAALAIAISSGSSGSPSNQSGPITDQSGGFTASPLVLDTDKDGQVEAQQGKGVDINGDGKADGAATGGDKMLAMGDIDADGKITGKEVFGDQTVDPFTGQKLNAKNGFDALNQVAKSAEKATGIKCIDDEGNVDAQKLKQALETSGKGSLGMISDDNVTKLESLGDVSKINTSNYKNQQQTGAVQHNQLGSYTDTQGNTNKVDDIWFKVA